MTMIIRTAILATATLVLTSSAFIVSSPQRILRPIFSTQSPPDLEQSTDNSDSTKAPRPSTSHANIGPLSPLVHAADSPLGHSELNSLRADIISRHSSIIKSFVDTSSSTLGQTILQQLFRITDRDNSGYLDQREVGWALSMLGFTWLEDKHVEKIFERADLNEDGEISMEEFMREAPKTLKVNLVKLAKKNGDGLGLLV